MTWGHSGPVRLRTLTGSCVAPPVEMGTGDRGRRPSGLKRRAPLHDILGMGHIDVHVLAKAREPATDVSRAK
jgi:hypothetical protein